jgi:integrase
MNRYSAMRRSEAVKLDWERVALDNTSARLTNTKSRRVKGKDLDRNRVVPFAPAIVEMLARRREASKSDTGAVFLTAAGARIWADAVTKAWERARRRAAKKHNDPLMLNKRLHDLRHTRITELGEDMPAAMIAKMSGHDDLASFMRYFNPKPEAMRKKMAEADRKRLAPGQSGDDLSRVETAAVLLAELSPEEMAQAIAKAFAKRPAA